MRAVATQEPSSKRADRRRRVLQAAMQLATEGGYDAVQMRDVASRAGVAMGTIYRYFSSKDHLLAAALADFAAELEKHVAEHALESGSRADRLVHAVRLATAAIEKQPRLFAAFITALTAPGPGVSECQMEVNNTMGVLLGAPLTDLPATRRDGVIRVLGHVWFASMIGWVNGWSNVGQVGDELEAAVRLLLSDS